ncbi:MAG: SusF/SusE family outer membrane protein [Bacteroidota bacterium]|jgi:hypothetical protein
MKTLIMKKYNRAFALCMIVLAASCADEGPKPTLGDESTFTPPVFKNNATGGPFELLPDKAGEILETFEWERTDYGVQLSTSYQLQMDVDPDFPAPRSLAETTTASAAITVERFNNTMLALGVAGFEEGTVYLRVRSTINGYSGREPVYSQVITRTATTYQDSECGNYCTIGVLGSATPGMWDFDIDMHLADPTKADKSTWTLTTYLTAGELKFRANDDWAINWGANAYPSGTGVQDGPNVPIPEDGYYKLELDDLTGNYTVTKLDDTPLATVGLVGTGQAGGWDNDTDLTQDPNDEHIWTATLTLTDGEVKFRANDNWDKNWGADTYPSGYGFQGGPNIPVTAGTYFIWFNDQSGQYFFMPTDRSTPYNAVGILGDGTPNGWDADIDLIQNPAIPYLWSKTVSFEDGEVKFRADDDWEVNWGGSDFPGGIGTQGGPNVPMKAGTYFVTFNTGTGEYYFLK